MTATATIPLSATERTREAERWNGLPAMRHLGARADFGDPETVRVLLEQLAPYHRGGLGTDAVNGAVIAGLCDAAVGIVGHLHAAGHTVGTAQLSVQFLRPLRGSRVVAEARLVRAGTHLVFARAEVRDDQGRLCAVCDGVVAILGERQEATDAAL